MVNLFRTSKPDMGAPANYRPQYGATRWEEKKGTMNVSHLRKHESSLSSKESDKKLSQFILGGGKKAKGKNRGIWNRILRSSKRIVKAKILERESFGGKNEKLGTESEKEKESSSIDPYWREGWERRVALYQMAKKGGGPAERVESPSKRRAGTNLPREERL